MQPVKLPLIAMPENRDNTTLRDAKLVNGYWEVNELKEHIAVKRPGMTKWVTVAASTNGYGVFLWGADFYSVFNGNLYKNGVSLGAVDSTGGVYAFSSCLGATPKLFLMNGVKGYTYDTVNGLVNVTNVNFPAALVKGAVYLDATMYVMDANGKIWGSNLNDPQTWTALNVIVAQIESDAGVAIAKQMVYVIAFKQVTTEVFYDAANATGSPLGAVQGAKLNVGCRSAGSVQDVDGTLCWVSNNKSGNVGVFAMANAQGQAIDTPAVARLLQGADYTTVYSWQAKINGHVFYVVTIKNSNLTLAFNVTTHMWSQWTDVNGNYLPIVASSRDSSQNVVLQHESNGNLYYFSALAFTDDSSTITFDLYTPNFDAGMRYRKIVKHLEVDADQTTGSSLRVRFSDDDYQTWSNFRPMDLGRKRPSLDNLGTFHRRAWHFRHQSNTALRIKTVELRMEQGTL